MTQTTFIQPSTELNLTLTLERKLEVADGVVELTFKARSTLPPWEPGSHIDLLLGPDLARQYSLCSDPQDRRYLRVAVLREPESRGGSEFVHEKLEEGQAIQVRGPRNNFPLVESPRYQFIAGGIGITPILPMIREVDERGTPWRLLYGGRTRRSMAFAERLTAEFGARVEIVPAEERGMLDLADALGEQRSGRRVYCCGPEPLLAAIEGLMADRTDETLHVERFSAGEVDSSGDAFDVEIASSGKTVHVDEGQSIIDALADAGVDVDFSCREGTCGTCETGVLGGVPDHRDVVLDDDEKAANDVMMICVGRCVEGPLLLDL